MESNPGFRSERPVTERLSHGTVWMCVDGSQRVAQKRNQMESKTTFPRESSPVSTNVAQLSLQNAFQNYKANLHLLSTTYAGSSPVIQFPVSSRFKAIQ
jgi:hypothetical protein